MGSQPSHHILWFERKRSAKKKFLSFYKNIRYFKHLIFKKKIIKDSTYLKKNNTGINCVISSSGFKILIHFFRQSNQFSFKCFFPFRLAFIKRNTAHCKFNKINYFECLSNWWKICWLGKFIYSHFKSRLKAAINSLI